MSGPPEPWRRKKGIFYPEQHVAFVLDGPSWPRVSAPCLPSSKEALKSAKILERIHPNEAQDSMDRAEQMREREETGVIPSASIQDGKDAIDTLLLCGNKNPQAFGVLAEILEYGQMGLQTLTEQAKSKQGAAELTVLLASAVERLRQFALESPKLFRETARQLPSFPMLVSDYREQQIENESLLNILEVGAAHWWKQHRKGRGSTSTSKPARAKEIAIQLIEYLQTYRDVYQEIALHATNLPAWTHGLAHLPQLSEKSWAKWFGIGWEVVLETTGGKPSEVDAYRKIARRTQRKNAYEKPVAATHSAIKEALRDAFQELAMGRSSRSTQKRD